MIAAPTGRPRRLVYLGTPGHGGAAAAGPARGRLRHRPGRDAGRRQAGPGRRAGAQPGEGRRRRARPAGHRPHRRRVDLGLDPRRPRGGGRLRPHHPAAGARRGGHGQPPLLAAAPVAGGGAGGAGHPGRRRRAPACASWRWRRGSTPAASTPVPRWPSGPTRPPTSCGPRWSTVGTDLLVDHLAARPGRGRAPGRRADLRRQDRARRARTSTGTEPADELHRLVRVGGAWTTFRGRRLKVWRTAVRRRAGARRSGRAGPGRARRHLVGTGDGVRRAGRGAARGQGPPGGAAWRNGARLEPGERSAGTSASARPVRSPSATGRRARRSAAVGPNPAGWPPAAWPSRPWCASTTRAPTPTWWCPALLGRSRLDERDRGFVTELVYGTTRMRRACDWLVDRYLLRDLDAADPGHAAPRRLPAGLPRHAAPRRGQRHRGRRAGPLRRAGQRRAAQGGRAAPRDWPDEATAPQLPGLDRRARWPPISGAERAPRRPGVDERAGHLGRARRRLPPGPGLAVGRPAEVGAEPGERVLDLCAAPGGKATALAVDAAPAWWPPTCARPGSG